MRASSSSWASAWRVTAARRYAARPASPSGFTRRTLLNVGEVYEMERAFGPEQVAQYAAASGDWNPMHLDDAAPTKYGHVKGTVHELLYASMFPAIICTQFPGVTYSSMNYRFREPVYVGELLKAEVVINHISGRKLAFDGQCLKVDTGVRVMDGSVVAILPLEWEQPVDHNSEKV